MPVAARQHSGFTLLELLITLAVSAIVMIGVMALFFNMVKHSQKTIEAGRLDRGLHAAMQAMMTDIRRAGYWGEAETSQTNPFMVSGSTDIEVNAAGNCILMTYDHNGDGTLPAISSGIDDERYGFRLINNVLQYRPPGAPYDCNTAQGNWDNLTDPNVIKVTALTFTKNIEEVDLDGTGPGTEKIAVRSITINLTGELVNDSSVTQTLTQVVKVYNDKFTP